MGARRMLNRGGGCLRRALLVLGLGMFSYHQCDGTQDNVDFVRLLCFDTVDLNHIFEDSEILAFYTIQQAQFQSSQFFSGPAGRNLPATPVSYLRVAALALDALAANKSRLASIKQQLDVKLDSADAAIQLRETAQSYRDTEDNSGAFAIIEQVQMGDPFSFRDRFWAQVQRQSAG